MKKRIVLLLVVLVAFSLAGCSATPSNEKIKSALDQGVITFDDAKAKGWIDEGWIQENYPPMEGFSKIHAFEPFDTTYLDGTPASSALIKGKMCLVFFDTQQAGTMDKLAVFKEAHEKMQSIGIPILGIILDTDVEAAKEKLADIPFPIIVYNEDARQSLQQYAEMLQGGVTSVFTKDGGFYSAWSLSTTLDELLSSAQAIADDAQ
ncbi:MAG: hypothetical protein RR482_00235 [Clostridia bacterium]